MIFCNYVKLLLFLYEYEVSDVNNKEIAKVIDRFCN